MLSQKNRLKVINILDSVLGIGTALKGNEQAHHCPFCHHHKKKLEINLATQQYHCWVCNAKGRNISKLLRKLHVDSSDLNQIYEIYGREESTFQFDEKEETIILQLPKEFKSLYRAPTSLNPIYKKARHYLSKRGIGTYEIQKYNIGYCEDGLYGGRIIIPSYDEKGNLNYFEARTFYDNVTLKYKKPPVNRNVIMFESQINWKEPVILVEGVFDSFSVRRNAIPLLGKFVPKKLMERIFSEGVKEVILMLDNDATTESISWNTYFLRNGIDVKNIIPDGKDFGDLGFTETIKLIKSAPTKGWDSIILDKLNYT